MGSWGQLIWVFFPIPIVSLFLLSIPGPRKLEKLGNDIVHKIFFTHIAIGKVHISLFLLFISISFLLFVTSVSKLNGGKEGFQCLSCRYETETYWYKKAMKYRVERNFWLSLFNFILWFLVWRIQQLKQKVIRMKDIIQKLEVEVIATKSDETKKEKVSTTATFTDDSLPKSGALKKKE